MNPLETFPIIESYEMSARLCVANNLRIFVSGLLLQPEIRLLIAHINDPEVRSEVLNRVSKLVEQEPEGDYINSTDIALAVYLYAGEQGSDRLRAHLSYLVRYAKNLFWTKRFLESIKRHDSETSRSETFWGNSTSNSSATQSVQVNLAKDYRRHFERPFRTDSRNGFIANSKVGFDKQMITSREKTDTMVLQSEVA